MDTPGNMDVDHANGNGLDNRRSNLRLCTTSENIQNQRPRKSGTSKYKGVGWFVRDSNWRVRIKVGDKQIHIGYFADEVEAAKAYDKMARQHFGAFARTNF